MLPFTFNAKTIPFLLELPFLHFGRSLLESTLIDQAEYGFKIVRFQSFGSFGFDPLSFNNHFVRPCLRY